jgi:hypothetical protein
MLDIKPERKARINTKEKVIEYLRKYFVYSLKKVFFPCIICYNFNVNKKIAILGIT